MASVLARRYAQQSQRGNPFMEATPSNPSNPFMEPNAPVQASNPLVNQYNLYNQGVERQAEDYGDIMNGYQDLSRRAQAMPMMNVNDQNLKYNAQTSPYTESADYRSSINNLQGLSETGGYSTADIQNLRERAISPIRSAYATASRDMDRNRRLNGASSPNYGAVTAKMTRDLSEGMANQMTNANANLAQNIAQNKLQVAPQYANVAQGENQFMNSVNMKNNDATNEAARYNSEMPFKVNQYNQGNLSAQEAALRGMTSLYGTTPAMSSLFGSQAQNAAQMELQRKQQAQQGAYQIAQRYA